MASSRPLAVITGASSGIGAEYARQLGAKGYDLALVARREDRLQELASELTGKFKVLCTPLKADLTRDADLLTIENFIAGTGNLELLVNNAGFGTLGRFAESPIEPQDAMHRLHVMATMRLTHAALGNLTARDTGGVINVASVAAFIPRPGSTSYYATKSWVNNFTECLHLELKSAGLRVRMQSLCPGFTYSEFHDVLGVERSFISGGWWMTAEDVVSDSLREFEKGTLVVIPGWRYKLLVGAVRMLPRGVVHYALTRGPKSLRRERIQKK